VFCLFCIGGFRGWGVWGGGGGGGGRPVVERLREANCKGRQMNIVNETFIFLRLTVFKLLSQITGTSVNDYDV
jgi:hypothetical protein